MMKSMTDSKEYQIREDVIELIDRAYLLQKEGRLNQALVIYKKALKLIPDIDLVLNNMGDIYCLQNKYDEATRVLIKAIEVSPNFANPYFNLATVYRKLSLFDEAISTLKKGLEIDSKNSFALIDLGILLITVGRYDEAVGVLQKELRISSEPLIYDLLGETFRLQHKYDKALEIYRLIIKTFPKYAKAYADMGLVWKDKGDYKKAVKYLIKAEKLEKKWQYLFYLGDTYRLDKNYLNAVLALKRSLLLNPNSEPILNCLDDCYRNLCDWDNSEKLEKKIDKLNIASPYISLLISDDPQKNLEAATREINRYKFNIDKKKEPRLEKTNKTKIRLGYFSADFNESPVAHLISGIFALHDRSRFEVVVYSYGANDGSIWRKRVENGSDKFVDLENKSDAEIINQIRNDKIDVLIDLMGHSNNSRIGLLRNRLAPIQVTYLGFPGTTGADFVDYIIADKVVIPEDEKQYFSEKVIYMPKSFMLGNGNLKVDKKIFLRREFGLPDGAVVYSSFVNVMKIDRTIFRVWMNILKKVPNSVLWLPEKQLSTKDNIKREARNNGVDIHRIIFSPRLPDKNKHLARLSLADISLDTRIYGGHTTTVDSLLVGVPVITVFGKHFASRVATSILKSLKLDELITNNLKEYEEMAVELGKNGEKLNKFKNMIIKNKSDKPFFDAIKFVRNLEKKLQGLV